MKRVAVAKNRKNDNDMEYSHCEVFEIENGKVKKDSLEFPAINTKELPVWAEKQGITDVITYKVNREIISHFASKKVNLFLGVPINSGRCLIDDYLNGKLESDRKIIEEITK